MQADQVVTAALLALEQELLTPATRSNTARLRELLAHDFEEVGSSGRTFSRDQIIAALQAEILSARTTTLIDFSVRVLAPALMQARYVSHRSAPGTVRLAQRTSIWQLGTHWQMVYHQGTPFTQ